MNIIAAILLLGALVFIHELGHFLAGVAMKVPVEVFSIGFGPTIFKKTIRGVIFQVAILPFGGYCKFKGEHPDEIEDDEYSDDDNYQNEQNSDVVKKEITNEQDHIDEDVSTKEASDSAQVNFLSISPLKRIFIYFAGPFSNYVLALVIFFALAMLPTKEVIYSPQVDVYQNVGVSSTTEQTLAYKNGFRPGDTIISINDEKVYSDKDILTVLSDVTHITAKDSVIFDVLRDGRHVMLSMPSKDILTSLNSMTGSLGLSFGTSIVFDQIVPNSAAAEVGLEVGDKVLAVDGRAVEYVSEFRSYITSRPNTKVELTILRGSEEINREIFVGENGGIGVIGVVFRLLPMSETTISGEAPHIAIKSAFLETKKFLASYIDGLSMLFTGKIPVRDSLAGPVRIIQVTSEVAKTSLYSFLQLGAILSIILFFMNLLPLPVVDGGMIIVNLIEIIFRRKVSLEVLSKIQMVGAVILITLAIFITVNDISFLFK